MPKVDLKKRAEKVKRFWIKAARLAPYIWALGRLYREVQEEYLAKGREHEIPEEYFALKKSLEGRIRELGGVDWRFLRARKMMRRLRHQMKADRRDRLN